MDPLHLQSGELEYELALRGVFNVGNNRLRTAALREILTNESLGRAVAPTRSDGIAGAKDEIQNCEEIFRNILARIGQRECMSRLIHLKNRLIRVVPNEPVQMQQIRDLIEGIKSASSSLELQLNNPTPPQSASQRDPLFENRFSAERACIMSNLSPQAISFKPPNELNVEAIENPSANSFNELLQDRRNSDRPVSLSQAVAGAPYSNQAVHFYTDQSQGASNGLIRNPFDHETQNAEGNNSRLINAQQINNDRSSFATLPNFSNRNGTENQHFEFSRSNRNNQEMSQPNQFSQQSQ